MSIYEEIEKRYKKAIESNEIKKELINNDKRIYLTYKILSSIFFTILTLVFLALIFACNNKHSKYVFLSFAIVTTIINIIIYLILNKANKVSDKERIFRQVKNQILKEKKLNQITNIDDIKQVTLLDSFTEYSDKLHAVLNFQEIIQKRYYKFRVDYKNGTSQIITTEDGSKLYNQLILLIKTDNNKIDNTEEIRNYKKLLDDGVITKKEFETKKKQLLDS